jgi:iron complex transport system permease protein
MQSINHTNQGSRHAALPGPRRTAARAWAMTLTALALLAVSMVLAAGIGSVHYSPRQVLAALLHGQAGTSDDPAVITLWYLRLPRIAMAALVGASLAAAGVAFQALLRNDLADPYVVGVSAGASVGAEAVLFRHGDGWLHGSAVPAASFAAALATMAAVYGIAKRGGRIVVTHLLLGGVIVSAFLMGISALLLMLGSPDDTFHTLARLFGSLQEATFAGCGTVGVALVAGVAILMTQLRAMNAYALGEESAAQLGVDTERFKKVLVLTGALLTSVTVSVAGIIGFVGLVVPHMARRLAQTPNHSQILPLSIACGALLMVWADTIARSVMPDGRELPVGVITAFLGAPFFCYLLRRKTAGVAS